jgi:hypothetical protein
MKKVSFFLAALLLVLSGGAYAYDFWGITMGTATCPINNSTQLTFTAPSADIQYEVGGYKYTKVGSTWYGSFPAASPGASYPVLQRECDAMGLFFTAKADAAYFRIIAGMPNTGVTASEIGYYNRQFGPGDLKIDVKGGSTYGVGLRDGGLLWAVNPGSTAPWYQIYNADGTVASMYSRDAGTIGNVVEDPTWAHVDNHPLKDTPYDPHGYAFYKAGTGTSSGAATISVAQTGVFLNGVELYCYEAIVPWDVIGIDPAALTFDLEASWRPDCGNDLIFKEFKGDKPGTPDIPEPYSVMLAVMGLSAVGAYRKRRS